MAWSLGSIFEALKSLGKYKDLHPDTTGPAEDEHPLVSAPTATEALLHQAAGFQNGIYLAADAKPANPDRVGGAIKPSTIVVHTTDMVGSESDLIRAWQTTVTSGACAHFLIHRDGKITQFVPINRNANHAGGPVHGHGNYRTVSGALVHPNTVAVGIEIHSGGLLKYNGKDWVHPDSKRTIAASDVYVDERHRGWQIVTAAQLAALENLIDDLNIAMVADPKLTVVPDGTYRDNGVADYAGLIAGRISGHVTLDPVNKSDPGTQIMKWLKDKYGND